MFDRAVLTHRDLLGEDGLDEYQRLPGVERQALVATRTQCAPTNSLGIRLQRLESIAAATGEARGT